MEGRQEGRLEGRQEAVIRLVETRFGGIPPEIVTVLASIKDLNLLDRLLIEYFPE